MEIVFDKSEEMPPLKQRNNPHPTPKTGSEALHPLVQRTWFDGERRVPKRAAKARDRLRITLTHGTILKLTGGDTFVWSFLPSKIVI